MLYLLKFNRNNLSTKLWRTCTHAIKIIPHITSNFVYTIHVIMYENDDLIESIQKFDTQY